MRLVESHLPVWWKALQALDLPSIPELGEILAGLNPPATALGLAPLANLPEASPVKPQLYPLSPSFQSFSCSMTLPLLAGLQGADEFRPQAGRWAEELMRFSEVRYPTLPRLAVAKWGDKKAAREGLIQVAAVLSEAHRTVGDLRYLNTVLKILDLRLAYRPSRLLASLRGRGRELRTAAFTLRVVVQTEASLRGLEAAA